jgi:hypothetical protein
VQTRLTTTIAARRASNVLARRFGRVWTHGTHKRMRARRLTANAVRCLVSWRYGRFRYSGRVDVRRSGFVHIRVVRRG